MSFSGYPETESIEILKKYKALLQVLRPSTSEEEKKAIKKAFTLAVDAHKDMRRKSGEPYVYHPIEVAHIAVADIGLGTTSVICALLHDVVEDTHYTVEDMRAMFGDKVATIIDGLTKISDLFDRSSGNTSIQAENFKKMLLTLSDDVRVILIKLADRLHNMRTLDSMPVGKQLKIASETQYLYAPLAHRLGLYKIKTELEDLSLKYRDPEIYQTICAKLADTSAERIAFINEFKKPLEEKLNLTNISFEIIGRSKSINSIWSKMRKKEIPFEEVYDLIAIRIILDSEQDKEKADCWKVYSIITETFRPNPERLRDWISMPKANGYEALHTTVMSQQGRWVEVQIRSQRMDEIAERGYAAHWKYKSSKTINDAQNGLDRWLKRIRELLQSSESNALDFVDDFKLNLFSEEIYVFTPKGEIRTLPHGAAILDFAYAIHTNIGNQCIGAKVNHKLVPLSYKLKGGDQIEIITSKIQTPSEDWFSMVATARAKMAIKEALKAQRIKKFKEGRVMLESFFQENHLPYNPINLKLFRKFLQISSINELYLYTASKKITTLDVKSFIKEKEKGKVFKLIKDTISSFTDITKNTINDYLIDFAKYNKEDKTLAAQVEELKYVVAPCCNPIPGDNVFGHINPEKNIIVIHRSNCQEAVSLMSTHGNRIVKTKWQVDGSVKFLVAIKIIGIDKQGILSEIIKVISDEQKINMQQIHIDTEDGLFDGVIKLFVHDTALLNALIDKLKKIDGVKSTYRAN